MECRDVFPGALKLATCLREKLGSFSALLTGSRARKEARGALSDVDIIVFAEGARRLCSAVGGSPTSAI
ncbi:MAG: nucleotidyltransferase domain-containing protein [Thermoproteus sp.]